VKNVLEKLNAIVLLFMFFITFIAIINRLFFNIPTSWSENLAQLSFIFVTFVGAASVMADESHIKVTVLIDRLGEGMQKMIRIIGRLLMILFLVIFVLGSYRNVTFNWTTGYPTVNWIKIGYMYLILFISGIIMIFYLCVNLYYDLFRKKGYPSEMRCDS
jgi:TRAP-type C4-dicarboxylate transport system permease small subunit